VAKAKPKPAPKAWPADKVERRLVADLVPDAKNARTHPEEQIAQLAAAITEWGWTMPVLVDEEGKIIAGHGRVMAAERLGLTEVPTMTAVGWSEKQKRAYILADNKLAMNSGWDDELLRDELADLGDLVSLTGFDKTELDALFETPEIEDGMFGSQNGNKVSATMMQFGEYRMKVDQGDYNRWLDALRNEVGFDKEAILAEISRRLRIHAPAELSAEAL
jgi:hypothetical protein